MSASKNLILLISSLLLNCQEPTETPAPKTEVPETKPFFLTASEGDKISRTTLQFLAAGFGQDEISALLKYDVESFIVTYSTTFNGDTVQASGVVMIPAGVEGQVPVVSLQHGTLFDNDEAPSVRSGLQGAEFLASAGYAALLPDYLGYGSSKSIFHPYYDRMHSASTVIDLIRAAREFLQTKSLEMSDELLLAGYSEGGYVTLAATREIEAHPEYGLKVTAVAAGAGGYDLSGMLADITSNDYYAYPGYLAFVLMAYNNTYEWNRPLTDFFAPPYAAALSAFMDGDHSGSFINSKLTTRVDKLFNPEFYNALHDPAKEVQLKNALVANSVAGWKTDVPIRLYHGTADQIIPYKNSETTLANFKDAGSANVSLKLLPGKAHGNGFEAMLRDFIPWFLAL